MHDEEENVNTIPAQEIKRRGITAVDALLKAGAVHVITQNVPTYVVMSEAQYRGGAVHPLHRCGCVVGGGGCAAR